MRFSWIKDFFRPGKEPYYLQAKGFYEINPFPGCNQLAISNHVFLEPEYRGKGFGQTFQADREKHLKELGYDAVICTVKGNNNPEIKLLLKNGWKEIFTFNNRETENIILVFAKNLNSRL